MPYTMLTLALAGALQGQFIDRTKEAQAFRGNVPVKAINDTMIQIEAEEFKPQGGWQPKTFGTNYFAATFANSFLSRKSYLGAPEQCDKSEATIEVDIPVAGKYLALVRYEFCYRFHNHFGLKVEQNGKVLLNRVYGSRDNLRIWAFRNGLKSEVAWPWGAGENMVWEGHDAFVALQPGKAKLTLIADKQPEPSARRNVDLVMLTTDTAEVEKRIAKENYLPLDGLLTQENDVFLKVRNKGATEVKVNVPHCTEHSPYWVHMRNWKPRVVAAKPGETTDWVEVGSLLDSLSDGQWNLTAAGTGLNFDLEFGLRNAAGTIESFQKLPGITTSGIALAYDGDVRYGKRIRFADDVLYDLVAYLKKQPVAGKAPTRTVIYGYTFNPKPENPRYTQALDEFTKLIGATAVGKGAVEDVGPGGIIRGYIDVRGVPTPKLEEYCQKLVSEGRAANIASVSLGDEIGLANPNPKAPKTTEDFRAWLKTKKLSPAEVDPQAGADWEKVIYNPAKELKTTNPSLYYWSKIYGYRFGINNLKERTDILKKYLPNAGIGANFSPHHQHMYLGETHHWISLFREGGMTMPWGEDYIWQVPVASNQVNFMMLDMFRSGLRGHPKGKIQYYVMPHTPNNTVNTWRRQWYGDLGHGAKILNLFEFRPREHAYTENHSSDPAMYQEVRKSIHELGMFEDIVQDGKVLPGQVAIWVSEAGDVYHDHDAPNDAAIRCLYLALRHAEQQVDFAIEGGDLKDYKVLYLTDAHVSRADSKAIAAWVEAGGTLYVTAGAGLFDEMNAPNVVLRSLLGIQSSEMQESPEKVGFEKQDLPFAKPVAKVLYEGKSGKAEIPVFAVRAKLKLAGAEVLAKFDDGLPAVASKTVGKGRAYVTAFLPGLSYFQPALPKRPVDRGANDDTYTHFLPENFDKAAHELINPARLVPPPVQASAPRIESNVIQAKQGTVITLINWNREPVKGLTVRVALPTPTANVTLASGRPVQTAKEGNVATFTLDLEVADALILR